ncbi:MAG: tetratricopeptide repeat protein [Chloroflexi bacterium]|nr:tetratricopeptide repeat protein [Chloroflexota bacterium]
MYSKQKLNQAVISNLSTCESPTELLNSAEELVKECPDSESAWFVLGAALKEAVAPEGMRCDPDSAKKHPRYPLLIRAFDRLIELNPEEPAHLWNRAMLRQSLGLFSEAIEDLEDFVSLADPSCAKDDDDFKGWLGAAYDHLGCNLLGVDRTEDALGALIKAVETNPNYRYAWEDLSMVYEILGNDEKVAECLGRAYVIAEAEKQSRR